MNKFMPAHHHPLMRAFISTLLLILASLVLITDSYAQQEYSQPAVFRDAELAQMLAPIALYPDSLLTHILIASTYPLEIVQANRWRSANPHLDARLAIAKAQDKNWDPSVTALLAFPNVLNKLSDDLLWTQQLGAAFLQDEARLLAAIQSLREQADEAGSLSAMEYMRVSRIGQQIIIEPSQKEIIYVPYYNPLVVYGRWHWYSYPPVRWTVPYYTPRGHGHFYWDRAVHIRFNYYFSTFNWHKQHVIVINHHNSAHYRHREKIITSHGAKRWHSQRQYPRLRTESRPQLHDRGLHPSRFSFTNERQQLPYNKNSDRKMDHRNKNSDSKVHHSKQLHRPAKQQMGRESLKNPQRQPAAHQQYNREKMPRQIRTAPNNSHKSDKSTHNRGNLRS